MKTMLLAVSFFMLNHVSSFSQIIVKGLPKNDSNWDYYLYDVQKKIKVTPVYEAIIDVFEFKGLTGKRFYEVYFSPEPNVAIGIIDLNGKVVIKPITGAHFTYNFRQGRIYQNYHICPVSYRSNKSFDGHGVRCNNASCIKQQAVPVTVVYDYDFKIINKIFGYTSPHEIYLDTLTNMYKLSKRGGTIDGDNVVYFDTDLNVIRDQCSSYVLGKDGKWVDRAYSDINSQEKNASTISIQRSSSTTSPSAKKHQSEDYNASSGFSQALAIAMLNQGLKDFNNQNTSPQREKSNESGLVFNAWQCSRCGMLKNGTAVPGGGYGGDCPEHKTSPYDHRWQKASTKMGFQCRRCPLTSYIIDHWTRISKGPCCGELGKCLRDRSHEWELPE